MFLPPHFLTISLFRILSLIEDEYNSSQAVFLPFSIPQVDFINVDLVQAAISFGVYVVGLEEEIHVGLERNLRLKKVGLCVEEAG